MVRMHLLAWCAVLGLLLVAVTQLGAVRSGVQVLLGEPDIQTIEINTMPQTITYTKTVAGEEITAKYVQGEGESYSAFVARSREEWAELCAAL